VDAVVRIRHLATGVAVVVTATMVGCTSRPPAARPAALLPRDAPFLITSQPHAFAPLPTGAVRSDVIKTNRALLRSDNLRPASEVIVQFFGESYVVRLDPIVRERGTDNLLVHGAFIDVLNRSAGFLNLRDTANGVYGTGTLDAQGDFDIQPFSGSDGSLVAIGPKKLKFICPTLVRPDDKQHEICTTTTTESYVARLDVGILYTKEVKCAGRTCDSDGAVADADCNQKHQAIGLIRHANEILKASSIEAEFHLSGVEEFTIAQQPNLDAMRAALVDTSKAPGDAFLKRRQALHADIMVLLVSEGNAHGVAEPLSRTRSLDTAGDTALAVLPAPASIYDHSLAHELGHVMGAGHQDGGFGLCNFSKAYDVEYIGGSILATNSSKYYDYFSGPYKPGSMTLNLGSTKLDNRRTLRLTRSFAEKWQEIPGDDFTTTCVDHSRPAMPPPPAGELLAASPRISWICPSDRMCKPPDSGASCGSPM
jgi:hypothetical protein